MLPCWHCDQFRYRSELRAEDTVPVRYAEKELHMRIECLVSLVHGLTFDSVALNAGCAKRCDVGSKVNV